MDINEIKTTGDHVIKGFDYGYSADFGEYKRRRSHPSNWISLGFFVSGVALGFIGAMLLVSNWLT